MTYSPLVESKQRLRAILPKDRQSVLFWDHSEAAGEELFALACKRDLEGIVAKHKFGPYLEDSAQWCKIRNLKYSQWGRLGKVLRTRARVRSRYERLGQLCYCVRRFVGLNLKKDGASICLMAIRYDRIIHKANSKTSKTR